jgi:predicted enzyme related to lactoylglutathione lyase
MEDSTMTSGPGDFLWYDVMTTDPEAGRAFYKAVFDWNMADAGVQGHEYTVLSVGSTGVGGLMRLPDDAKSMGVPPCWTGYIGSADVDSDAKRLTAAGGSVRKPAQDIPGVGRFAVVADPHGAVFMLFKPTGTETPGPALPPEAPGNIGWRELMAGDGAAAFAFYAEMFGWTKAEAHDMGPMGVYQLFAKDGVTRGGMMTKMPEMPVPCWGFYVNAEAIDAAAARVTRAGGTIVNGPMEVPGGQWIVQCTDPQGAHFGIVAPSR